MSLDPKDNPLAQWGKERLAEIEATLAVMESRVSTLQTEARKQTEKAIADIQVQRAVFQRAMLEGKHQGEAAVATAKSALEANWASFEAIVQRQLSETKHQAEEFEATFKARAEAQQRFWKETIDAWHGQASTFAAAGKHDMEAALNHFKAEVDGLKSGLEAKSKAGEQSWAAMKSALEESRAAFEKASHKAQEAFKKAT